MKRILLTVLVIMIGIASFAAIGYSGYRLGYAQGAQAATSADAPQLRPFDRFGRDEIPGRPFGFDRGLRRGFDGFAGRGSVFFAPFLWLIALAILGIVGWFAYWLVARSGWRLTRESTTAVPPALASNPEPPQEPTP